jgi:ribosomal protein L31
MGCFDTVIVRCPSCTNKIQVQSKAHDCDIKTFSHQQVPLSIAEDLDEVDFRCGCGARFKLVSPVKYVRMDIIDID